MKDFNILVVPIAVFSRFKRKVNMKYYRFLPLLLLFVASFSAPACKSKYGCEATESLQPKTNRKGEIKKSGKSQSGLFSSKMSKKMK